jgi:hypothetical protein
MPSQRAVDRERSAELLEGDVQQLLFPEVV